ncbi:hypothetical protein H180DRAFT_03204 [Streptomyces sp. WMMB 322]|nr:hypothetical protein H180DRAFT_03204 [Streptomyces sp. WMMB 322]
MFHRNTQCEALHDGQRKARRYGRDLHDPQNVALSVAMSEGRGACIACFPSYRPTIEAKPCLVLVEGSWRSGLLTRWERSPNGRWTGHVSCIVDGDQVTMTKDQAELRKAEP